MDDPNRGVRDACQEPFSTSDGKKVKIENENDENTNYEVELSGPDNNYADKENNTLRKKKFKGVKLKERPRCDTCLAVLQLQWDGAVPKFCSYCASPLEFTKAHFELSKHERWVDPAVELDSEGSTAEEDESLDCDLPKLNRKRRHILDGVDDTGKSIKIEHKPDHYAVQDAKTGAVILIPAANVITTSVTNVPNKSLIVSADQESAPSQNISAAPSHQSASTAGQSPVLSPVLGLQRAPITVAALTNPTTSNLINPHQDQTNYGIHVEIAASLHHNTFTTNGTKGSTTDSNMGFSTTTPPIAVSRTNFVPIRPQKTPNQIAEEKDEERRHGFTLQTVVKSEPSPYSAFVVNVKRTNEVVCDVCPFCLHVMETPPDKQRPKLCMQCKSKLPTKFDRTNLTDKDFLGLYSCDVCAATFGARDKLTRHMNTVHSDERPYQCLVCQKTFKLSYQYNRHMKVTHPEIKSWYQCEQCDYSCDQKSKLNDHLKHIHSGDPSLIQSYECQSCNEPRYIPYNQQPPEKCPKCLDRPVEFVHRLKAVLKSEPDSQLEDETGNSYEVSSHSPNTPTIHTEADSNNTPSEQMLHALNLEPKLNRVLATSATHMPMDVDVVDANEQTMNISDQMTPTQKSVNGSQDASPAQSAPNQDTENTAVPGSAQEPLVQKIYYPQDWAGMSKANISDCVEKDNMIATTVQMTGKPVPDGETIHQCDEPNCGAIFNQRNKLVRHQKTVHSEERPFQCEMCEKTFKRNDGLLGHIRVVHMGQKYSYRCKFCNERFPQQSILNQHVKAIHFNDVKTENGNDSITNDVEAPHVNGVTPPKVTKKPPKKRKRYKCNQCGERFYKISMLNQHKDELHIAGEETASNDESDYGDTAASAAAAAADKPVDQQLVSQSAQNDDLNGILLDSL